MHAGDIKLLFRTQTKSILKAESDREMSMCELFPRKKSPLHAGQYSTHISQTN